ncbi:Conserved oligomeric Golgi complex subunit 8 [Fulvia fulva]|uniref:Conserved oligomeric Golgi complex subunit 8 n=1 Tax=Passalora fulva TaxID=5499 RepID=A0A9Q8LF26_PASFU|nr:Conserved oligomeric Golgi complex subunit 8 [Fulvia fulva]KAK4628578.1 Conserved oligomeric Golgi complex subunit 8 [Fulvia fulva]UJO16219.1 Conserved oligomeric Golgi complex subunit 8 [Fulvia fulva]WPV28246.1 Conserved oligomeric Golgi complex subunit 8 [Fulvia fulva]
MADPLYELLAPYLDNADSPPSPRDPQTADYLSRLSTLSFPDLTTNEPASLLQSAQSHLRNLQALSKRSHKAVIASSTHLTSLSSLLPTFGNQARALSEDLPELEDAATKFAQKYDRSTENAVLDRRKRAALLSRNADRVSDVLDLPSLLSSTVTAAQAGTAGRSTAASSTTSYTTALDISAHIKRLKALYPQSDLISNIAVQSDAEIQNLATILITSLQSPTLKLAAAMRTVGLLRRVAPELAGNEHNLVKPGTLSTKYMTLSPSTTNDDGALGYLFLICRLRTLHSTLEALDPLRELADQESGSRKASSNGKASNQAAATTGSQSERYLKRYIELFREQSFGILSMYKSIFPTNPPEPEYDGNHDHVDDLNDPLLPMPSPVATFALHLVDMLETALQDYLPNISEKASRESLLTQVLYCAGSLGRLGADFSMTVALLEEETERMDEDQASQNDDPEWVQVMQKHRVQASRLEVLARGVGSGRKTSMEVHSPSAMSPLPG